MVTSMELFHQTSFVFFHDAKYMFI